MKRKIALLLSMALLLSGCAQEQTPNPTTTTTTAPETSATTTTPPPALSDPFEDLKNLDKELKIVTYAMSGTTFDIIEKVFGEFESVEEDSETGGRIKYSVGPVVVQRFNYAEFHRQCGLLIASGDPPDICYENMTDFPHVIHEQYYQPVDEILAPYADEWTEANKYMDKFMIGGKHYCVFTDADPMSLFWYRNSVIEGADLEDPYELYKKGEWTWDKFTEMAEAFKNSGEDRYACDGYYVARGIMSSAGVPMVGIDEGKVKLNIYDPTAEKAVDFITSLVDNGYNYPRKINGNMPNVYNWVDGNTLFYCDSTWFYSNDIQKFMRRYEWSDNEVGVVPVPISDSDGEKYIDMSPSVMYMYVKGSDNPEGVTAWMRCVNSLYNSEEYEELSRKQLKEQYYWTDELLERIEEFENAEYVFELSNGAVHYGELDCFPYYPLDIIDDYYVHGEPTYEESREQHGEWLQNEINKINSAIE